MKRRTVICIYTSRTSRKINGLHKLPQTPTFPFFYSHAISVHENIPVYVCITNFPAVAGHEDCFSNWKETNSINSTLTVCPLWNGH